MKKKVILIILSVSMLSVLIYRGVFFSLEISKIQLEYNQTGIEALKDIINSHYTSMYVGMLYTILCAKILFRIDALYISKYESIIKGRTFIFWFLYLFEIAILAGCGQLLYLDPRFYNSFILMLIFLTTSLELLFFNKHFIAATK